MEIGEAIRRGILHIINEKEEFPIGEVNDYLISNRIINERIDFREIFSIAEPILRELGLKWYGVYGLKGIIICKPKHVEEKKEERKAKEEQRKARTTKEVVDELEKRISKNGMAYIPENIYESINHYLTHLFGESLDNIIERHEWKINKKFERLKGVYGKANEWDGAGSIQEDESIYRDKRDVLAYILYYFYENYPKIKYILLEGLKRGIKLIPEKEVVEILDFGTGPGTVLAGICDFISDAKEAGIYQNIKLKLYFIEENEDFADACEKMLEDVSFAEVKRVNTEIINNSHQRFDLITISNVLSELKMNHEERKGYLNRFRAKLKSNGYMIIIEPAYGGEKKYLQKLYKEMGGYYRSGCKFPPNDRNHSCLCFKYFIERKKLRTPEKTTRRIKEHFEKKKNVIKYVYAIFRREKEAETDKIKIEREKEYLDPCEVGTRIGRRINVYGAVVNVGDVLCVKKKDGSTTKKREIIICNGYGGCRLVFWGNEITKSDNISENDILYMEKAYVAEREYGGLIQVYIGVDTEVRRKTFD